MLWDLAQVMVREAWTSGATEERENLTLAGRASRLISAVNVLGRGSIVMTLTVLAFTTIPLLRYVFRDFFTPDESMLLIYPERILMGQWPNRDFYTAYGPGQFWLLAGAYRVFGMSILTERMVGWLLHLAIAFGVVRIVRFRGRFVAGMAGCGAGFILSFLGLPAFAWLSALSLVVWSIGIMAGKTTKTTSVVAGLMVGLVLSIRPEVAPAVILCQLPLLWRSQLKFSWMQGLALGVVPMLVHLVVAGPAFMSNFLFIMQESSAGIAKSPDVALSLRLAVFALVACVAMLAWTAVRERTPLLVAITIMSLFLLPQAFQRADVTHIAYVGCFIWPMWFVLVFSRFSFVRATVNHYGAGWLRGCLSLGAATLLGAALIITASSWKEVFWLNHLDRSVPRSDVTMIQKDHALIGAINDRVPSGGRIFVGAVDMSVLNYSPMYLYFLLPEYRPAGYYLELPGGFGDVGKALSLDIRKADVLVLSDIPEAQHLLYRDGYRGPADVNAIVGEDFYPAGRYGNNLLYIRRPS